LIVEDDAGTRSMYRDALRHAGFQVIAVEDGLDALRRIEEERVDAVVLDLMLPRVGGEDVYKEMRAHPTTRLIPIIIVTASDVRELAAGEFPHVLRKPVTPESLVAAIHHAFRRREPDAEVSS
jgi:two-component system response regulator MprA